MSGECLCRIEVEKLVIEKVLFLKPNFFMTSEMWTFPLTPPTPLITLSLSQQWLVAQPYLKANAAMIKG
jgi:hypothetical protein